MKNQKGFSLVELLVVVIIIAIIAAIAIPNLLASRRAGNEASAISSLRTIHSAEATYQATLGSSTRYGTLEELGTANLIDDVLGAAGSAARSKSGYDINGSVTATSAVNYCATANPQSASTGTRYFSVSVDGVIYQSTAAASCTGGTWGAGTSSTPIQ